MTQPPDASPGIAATTANVPATARAPGPGITPQLADRIVSQRAQVGGFTSAEDLGLLLDVSPDFVDGLRDLAVFPPG
jgi:hypothetical protein